MKRKIRVFVVSLLLLLNISLGTVYASNCDMGEWSYTSMYVKVHYYISIVNNIFPIQDKVWFSSYMHGDECDEITEDLGTYYIVQKNSIIVAEGTLYSGNRSVSLNSNGVVAGYIGDNARLYMQNKYDNPTPFVVTVSD